LSKLDTERLSRQDLVKVLELCEACLTCRTDDAIHPRILDFADFLGFEFVLYAYQKHAYQKAGTVEFVNLSNPVEWMDEYHENDYLLDDPIRIELEVRLASEGASTSILWDAYAREISAGEKKVIERRTHFGLRYGFSVYDNAETQNFVFLISFASKEQRVDDRCQAMGRLVVPHLNRCRKRLDLLLLVERLTARERAVARWVVEGKTNWEIAKILGVTESTVKFHLANVFRKLGVANRQGAIAILLATKLLS
jgi:DNA-binding CsgD family transcriptional regulator